MSAENPWWGSERNRGELRKLGIAVSNGSIRRYRWRPAPRPPSQTWRTFLRTHAPELWAADLVTVPTVTFRTLFVLFFIRHEHRELLHVRVTAHPTAARVGRQLIEATAWADGLGTCSGIATWRNHNALLLSDPVHLRGDPAAAASAPEELRVIGGWLPVWAWGTSPVEVRDAPATRGGPAVPAPRLGLDGGRGVAEELRLDAHAAQHGRHAGGAGGTCPPRTWRRLGRWGWAPGARWRPQPQRSPGPRPPRPTEAGPRPRLLRLVRHLRPVGPRVGPRAAAPPSRGGRRMVSSIWGEGAPGRTRTVGPHLRRWTAPPSKG